MINPKFYQAIQSEPGHNLFMMRTMAGLSVLALSKATGVHRQTISKIEACKYPWEKMPMGILMKLYAHFGQRLVITFEPQGKEEETNYE